MVDVRYVDFSLKISLLSNFLHRVFFFRTQSQPCHWRNLKTVAKRDVTNQTLTLDSNSTSEEKKGAPLPDNISLLKSLRVLQEGEGEDVSDVRSKIFLSLFR